MLILLVLLAAPVDVTVPAELRAKTCAPELSGVTWVPALSRYLAVSDDTGLLDTPSWHAPWLFTFDAKGVLDPSPTVLEGIDTLDDAESITPGPPGTFFLATSHTTTKKGKSKPARRQLLWLALEGKRLVVKGGLDLTSIGMDRLVTGQEDELDIEAIAYREGALYVGFKAPLDASGHAAIARLENIVGAFDKVKPAAIVGVVWARPKLEVADAAQGVTDLLFLPDGRLLVAANAPKSGKPDGGGAVWLLAKPDAKPVLLHRFLGLKPEGLTLSPDGKQLVVVFDRGQDPAQWVQLAVPK